MNKRRKQLIKKHVGIVKSIYPEVNIAVRMVMGNILVNINSLKISNEAKYEALIYDFVEEYDKKRYFDIIWGVNSSLTSDNLSLLEDFVEAPVKENFKQKAANF